MILFLLACTPDGPVPSAAAEPTLQRAPTAVRLLGDVHGREDISGAAALDGRLYVVSDEGGGITRLRAEGQDFIAEAVFPLPSDREKPTGKPELDLEALCVHPGGLIAVGSHSAKRKKVKAGRTRAENLARLGTVEAEKKRRILLPLTLTDAGVRSGTPIPGFDALQTHPLLADAIVLEDREDGEGPWRGSPSKENGLDIEGATCTADTLSLGLRGPVVRGGYALVVDLAVPDGTLRQTRFVDLQGQGIRDMARIDDGWLLLAGPVGDGPSVATIWHWDGQDCLPGKDVPGCRLQRLDQWLPEPLDGEDRKAEALVVERTDPLQVLVLYDGHPSGERRTLPR
jgi:hypothetical protein